MIISLKTLLILGAIAFTPIVLKAQNYNPVFNYSFSGTPVNGVKIKTNIPFIHGIGMPTIIIEGYNYGESSPMGLIINWYVYDNQFINYGISSFGAYTPEVKLSQENGKVVIFINDKKYYNRFTARAFAIDKGEDSSWFSGWNITDENLSGAGTVILPYKNTVGELKFPGGIINSKGQIGIGTNDPQFSLDVSGSSQLGDFVSGGTNSWIFHTPDDGRKTLHIAPKKDQQEWDWNRQLIINGENGNVGIGISNPQNRLDVNGTVHAKEVKVDMSGWADFVFHKDYHLPTLDEVEKHINEKGHLPNIPSTKEVTENGLSLGENQKLLLQKIEELTLYSIEQNKLIKEQQKRITKLEEAALTLTNQ